MQEIFTFLAASATSFIIKIVLAAIVFFVGRLIIKSVLKLIEKGRFFNKAEGTVKTFALSFIKIGLYVILIISVIGILGIPLASVVTVLASAGVAIGLALQGALSNLAGGIMLMVFKPFKQGDFVEASGVSGTVSEVTLFYTVILTIDNKRITVPNGNLMNANITNYSSEDLRMVDMTFSCAKSESSDNVSSIILGALSGIDKILADPEPVAKLNGGTNEAMNFTVRAWCKNADYWDVYFDMNRAIANAFAENGVKGPALRITSDK